MARLRRVVVAGHTHLIVHRGHSGAVVFADATDCGLYLASLQDAAREFHVAVHAYALLPSEVRLLVTPGTPDALAQLMQSVGRRYVRGHNYKYVRSGSPWDGRFRSTVIEAQRYFVACVRYVETAGGDEWPDSEGSMPAPTSTSLAHHLGTRVDPLIADHPAFWALGNTPFEREVAYRRYVQARPSLTEASMFSQACLSGWVLGSAAFIAYIGELTGRRPAPVARGRPRKSN